MRPVNVVGWLLVLGLAAACGGGGSGSASSGGDGGAQYIDGFNPPPVADGYTRYVTPVIDGITPGTDTIWCQWLAPAATADQDSLDVTGMQSKYGHHVVLYATTISQPAGFSRVCTSDDMLSVRYLGAIGGEGGGTFKKLPPNVALRLNKGEMLMANVHFLNTSASDTVQGQAVLDVKWADPSSTRQIASFFVNVSTTTSIPTAATNYAEDVSCPIQQDIPFILAANHMHKYGIAAASEIIHADGTKQTIVEDTLWTSDEQFNPKFVSFPVGQELLVHKGDVVHTQCVWNGDPLKTLNFPDEMCGTFGFYLPADGSIGPEIHCTDGSWPQ